MVASIFRPKYENREDKKSFDGVHIINLAIVLMIIHPSK